MPKSTRMRRYALIDEEGNIRGSGVWVDGLYLIHETGEMWGGCIKEADMRRFLEARKDEPLKLIFADGDCLWRPEDGEVGAKYLDDLGIEKKNQYINFIPDREEFAKQRAVYGFDQRETYFLDCLFVEWLYQRLKMLVDASEGAYMFDKKSMIPILDPEDIPAITVNGETKPLDEWVRIMIEKCEAVLLDDGTDERLPYEKTQEIARIFAECINWMGW